MGGWVRPNDYVCLHSGWVGVAKCLRNLKELKNGYPENTELIKAPKTSDSFYPFEEETDEAM